MATGRVRGAAHLAARPAHGLGVGEVERRERGSSQTSSATRSSMRARCEPAQRWMPSPNAAWRFTSRSMMTSSALVERAGVAVGGGERQQHPVVGLHRAAVELDVLA